MTDTEVPEFVQVLQREPQTHETIACPLCGGSENAAVYEGIALRGNDIRLAMCQDCSHFFINPRPTLATFEEFYASDGYFHLCADYYDKTLEETFEQFGEDAYWDDRGQHGRRLHAQYLTGRLGKDDLVFDFGCGDGGWLWGLQQATGCSVAGEEISEVYVKTASEKLGVQIVNGAIEASAPEILERYRGKVKLAIVSGSLQHMLDPMLCLRTARELLTDDGLLYVCNWGIFEHFMTAYADQPRRMVGEILSWEHLHYFHETSFRYMVEAAGFEVEELALESTVRPRHMEILARKSDRPAQLPSARAVEAVAMRLRALESATILQRQRRSLLESKSD